MCAPADRVRLLVKEQLAGHKDDNAGAGLVGRLRVGRLNDVLDALEGQGLRAWSAHTVGRTALQLDDAAAQRSTRRGKRTESFSTMALLPMNGELSHVIIEWSRCSVSAGATRVFTNVETGKTRSVGVCDGQ